MCQVTLPHSGHFIKRFGLPLAFHRTPPHSHTERSCPHGHLIFQAIESRRMSSAQDLGRMAVRILCESDIGYCAIFLSLHIPKRLLHFAMGWEPMVLTGNKA